MKTTHITFPKITQQMTKSVKCACGCGKKIRKQKTFWQTQNPFNKNKDGSIKTRDDIYAELHKEAIAWESQPECVKGHSAQ